MPLTTWKSLSPPRGLRLYPSRLARCSLKTSKEMDMYPAPSAAQLLTMLLHREHYCSHLYYTQFPKKINIVRFSNVFRLTRYVLKRVVTTHNKTMSIKKQLNLIDKYRHNMLRSQCTKFTKEFYLTPVQKGVLLL